MSMCLRRCGDRGFEGLHRVVSAKSLSKSSDEADAKLNSQTFAFCLESTLVFTSSCNKQQQVVNF